MTRVLLAIGCNVYDHIQPPLVGAESDAKRIFEELIKPEVGAYDAGKSRLLLSPTLSVVRACVKEALADEFRVDEFTIYFAGHGCSEGAGFYLALRDSRSDRLSSTSLWLSELFSNILEAGPVHTSIILDACFSGTMSVDLATLGRPGTSGNSGSPAITLLAMSARDQTAGEFPNGGIGTIALLDCITGRALVREDTRTLELADTIHVVTERVKRVVDQNPILSVFNIHERSHFCFNKHFYANVNKILQKWEPREFLDMIEPILASHSEDSLDLINNIERLTNGLIEEARTARDVFKSVEIQASAIVALLPYCGMLSQVDTWIRTKVAKLSDELHQLVVQSVFILEDEKYALLAGPAGLANLYLLPIRLAKLLGWTGAAYHLDRILGRDTAFPADEYRKLLQIVVKNYGVSFVAMNDMQTPYLLISLTTAQALLLHEEAELILCSTFNSFIECNGKVAHASLKANKILDYLFARMRSDFSNELVARPSEMGLCLMLCATLFDLVDVFDEAMIELDHLTINAFIPDNFSTFGARRIDAGENCSFRIGGDVWAIADILQHLPGDIFEAPVNPATACSAIIAALLFPDRVPWFVYPSKILNLQIK